MDRAPGLSRGKGTRQFFRHELARLARVVRHEARLDQRDKDGTSQREHLQALAKRGRLDAAADLEGPPFPEALRYLYDWLQELHGRSGVGMSGYAPLTWSTLDAWARTTDTEIRPHEARALITLDAVMCFPGKPEDDDA